MGVIDLAVDTVIIGTGIEQRGSWKWVIPQEVWFVCHDGSFAHLQRRAG
jgi:hypothetical protein